MVSLFSSPKLGKIRGESLGVWDMEELRNTIRPWDQKERERARERERGERKRQRNDFGIHLDLRVNIKLVRNKAPIKSILSLFLIVTVKG